MAGASDMDLSSFMAILIMTIGCMVIILVTNVIVIISNPENMSISTLIPASYGEEKDPELAKKAGPPLFSNKVKEPSYVDVHPDRLIIYPGEIVVPVADLEQKGNPFEQLLDKIQAVRDQEYIIVVQRPGTTHLGKQLQRAIQDREIDFGRELFSNDEVIKYVKVVGTGTTE